MIDINEQKRQWMLRAGRTVPFVGKNFLEPSPIGNIRQGIQGGQIFKKVSVFFQLEMIADA